MTEQTPFFIAHIDLGQVINATSLGIIGYFVKRTIDQISDKIEKHESILFNLSGDIQRIIGKVDTAEYKGMDRRRSPR